MMTPFIPQRDKGNDLTLMSLTHSPLFQICFSTFHFQPNIYSRQQDVKNNPTPVIWLLFFFFSSILPVWSWTGDPLRRDFADQKTVARTADVLFPDGSVFYRLRRETRETKTQRQARNMKPEPLCVCSFIVQTFYTVVSSSPSRMG